MKERRFRTYRDVADPASESIVAQVAAQGERLAARLTGVRRIVAIGSGKGGVGKSAITANLAAALAARGHRVGAVDADLNGPSLGRMLGAGAATTAGAHRLSMHADGIEPVRGSAGVRVISMDFLLSDDDTPVRWREGEGGHGFVTQSVRETGALREFLADVRWGELDYLVVDVPPGTDKILRLIELLPRIDTMLLVTTSSEAARFVVAKSVKAARESLAGRASEIGLVVNMTGLFDDGGEEPPDEAAGPPGIMLWARIPFEPALARSTDAGRPWVLENEESPASREIFALARRLEDALP